MSVSRDNAGKRAIVTATSARELAELAVDYAAQAEAATGEQRELLLAYARIKQVQAAHDNLVASAYDCLARGDMANFELAMRVLDRNADCPQCGGSGTVLGYDGNPSGEQTEPPCSACKGSGRSVPW